MKERWEVEQKWRSRLIGDVNILRRSYKVLKRVVYLEVKHWENDNPPSMFLARHHHCLYLIYGKSTFPLIPMPDLYNYEKTIFSQMKSWHGRVNFFQEIKKYEEFCTSDLVKYGCSFDQDGDERTWGQEESSEKILREYGPFLLEEFEEIARRYHTSAEWDEVRRRMKEAS